LASFFFGFCDNAAMSILYILGTVVAAYLLGSLSFAVIVSKFVGLKDPRTYGSKNPGATNVLRSGNKRAAIATLVLDALKGFLPVLLVNLFGERLGMDGGTVALVAVATVVGHMYPVFFGFKGGKGVATAAGAVFGIHWALGLAVLVSFAVLLYFTRFVSLASMVAAAFAPVAYLFADRVLWFSDRSITLALFVIAVFLVMKHSANINRLAAGAEPKLGQKA
jgi:acyl phosphate:glycerol-3-phosphate acyltransferase